MADLDKLEELAKAATPGHWVHVVGERLSHDAAGYEEWAVTPAVVSLSDPDEEGRPTTVVPEAFDVGLNDAAFIAAANPPTVLELIALARRDGVEEPVAWVMEDLILPSENITRDGDHARRMSEYRYQGQPTCKVTALYAHPAPASAPGDEKPLTKAQRSQLFNILRFGSAEVSGSWSVFDALAARGLIQISEYRIGFYRARPTERALAAYASELGINALRQPDTAAETWVSNGGDGEYPDTAADPVEVTIFCPACGVPHIDEGEWATTRHHKTHQCQACGHEWRPFPFATVGVAHPKPSDASTAEDASMARGDRDRTKRAIADGFSNGYEPYDQASEMQRLCYDMAADAVLALRTEQVRVAREAFEDVIRRAETYEHIRLAGKTPAARKAGTLRNIITVSRQALANINAVMGEAG